MSKSAEMYINDSKGCEDVVRISFQKILEIFASTPGWSQEKLADILKINSTTLRKYRREGSVSLYTTKRLSELLGLDQNYFNGKLPLTEDIEQAIRDKLTNLQAEEKSENESQSTKKNNVTNELISLLRNKIVNANSYDDYSLSELEELKSLFEKNLLMVSGKIQIVQVVENSNREEF